MVYYLSTRSTEFYTYLMRRNFYLKFLETSIEKIAETNIYDTLEDSYTKGSNCTGWNVHANDHNNLWARITVEDILPLIRLFFVVLCIAVFLFISEIIYVNLIRKLKIVC